MSDDLYKSFEDKYRGSRELITSRLTAYLDFIAPLRDAYPGSRAIDLGCGRGEWLELLLSQGFNPLGVEQDQEMLQACLERNLPAERGDAIAHLSSLSSETQTVVSAFHVVEHIAFDQLRTLISEALRVLKPGGLLIMETPNPENIVVATQLFYLDPTHQRPIPPQLLSFLPEYYGFVRVKIVRLQEPKELVEYASPTLSDVLGGVSLDYAVVAQKAGPASLMEDFDETFERQYGISLDALASRYDKAVLRRLGELGNKADEGRQDADRLADEIGQLKEIVALQASRLDALQNASVYNSIRRRIIQIVAWNKVAPSPLGSVRALFRQAAVHASSAIMKRPAFTRPLIKIIRRFPVLYAHLRQFAISHELIPGLAVHTTVLPSCEYDRDWLFIKGCDLEEAKIELASMSAWQRKIFMAFIKACHEKRSEGER